MDTHQKNSLNFYLAIIFSLFLVIMNCCDHSFKGQTSTCLPWPRHWEYRMQWLYISFTKQNIQNSANISILPLLESVTYSPTHWHSLICSSPPFFFDRLKNKAKSRKQTTNAEILSWGRSIEIIYLILLLCYI